MNEAIGWVDAVLLGILQGVTEFLPISSSGPLVLGQAILGFAKPQLLFDILVHMGTLVAVLAVYGKDAWRIVKAWLLSLIGKNEDRASLRTAWLIIFASVPAGMVGIFFDDFIESLFASPRMTSLGLIATGTLLFFSKFSETGGKSEAEISWLDALIIGLFQSLAIIPGISRSGSTITSALFRGIDREMAARFSFLLSIPAIGGAFVLKAKHLADASPSDMIPLIIGTVAAALAGVIALRWLLRHVQRGYFRGFAYYCWALGTLGIVGTFIF